MAEVVDGKVVMKAPDGRLFRVAPEEADQATRDLGWSPAGAEETAERAAAREQYSKFGSTGQQALGALEQTVRTASFGTVPGGLDWKEREAVLREESPVVSAVAQGVGSVAPALVGGGLLTGAARLAGAGGRAATLVGAAGEGLAGGLAEEVEQARFETRGVSAGNVLLFGLGGEIVGRALPKGIAMGAGKIRKAVSPLEELTGEGVSSAVAATERNSVKSQARLAREMQQGPERAEALRRTAPQQYEQMAVETADDLDAITEMAGRMGDTSSSKSVTQRLRDTLADESPAQQDWFTSTRAKLAEAKRRVRSPMGETPYGPLAPDTPELSGDLKTIASRFDKVIDTGLKRLDKTTDTVEQYLIARDVKKQLQHVSSKMGRMKSPQDEFMRDEMRAVVDDTWGHIQGGLKDRSLFGDAAEIEADINGAWSDKMLRGLGVSEQDLARKVDVDFKTGRHVVEFDPDKARTFLQKDRVGRTIAQRKLEQVLEGAEDMAAAHGRHGTWDKAEVEALRTRVARVRENLGLADEIHGAKGEPASGGGSTIGDEVAEFAAEKLVGSVIPFAGQAIRFGKRLLGLDNAGRQATRQTARKLAGTGLGKAQSAFGKVGDYGALPAMTALARFTGDYSGPEESFEAKKRILADELVSPDVLYEVLATTLDDMPRVNPELFQQIAGRVAQKIRYVREHLPAGIANTLMYPNGTPPSMSALREFGTIWNTVFNPSSVLEDIESGVATQLQMKTLRESDPDIYEQLRADVIEEVGINFRHVPITTKLQLDLLFQADGLAGPMFSSAAARMIGDAYRAERDKPKSGNQSEPEVGELEALAQPGGISAIQSSVTNRGAA
jgi:hypothetical protein